MTRISLTRGQFANCSPSTGWFNAVRESTISSLQEEIRSVTTDEINRKCNQFRWSTWQKKRHAPYCQSLGMKGHYLEELYRNGIWPALHVDGHSNVQAIIKSIHSIRPHVENSNTSKCVAPGTDVRSILQTTTWEIVRDLKGLCLKCAKAGRFTPEEDNCCSRKAADCKYV